jgi:hypothetical protein
MVLDKADTTVLAATALVHFTGLSAEEHKLMHRQLIGINVFAYGERAAGIPVCHFELEGMEGL